MTKAELWGKKLVLADSLDSETVKNVLRAAEPEIISRKREGEVTLIEFVDGSFLRASPLDTPLGTKGLFEWSQ